VSKEIQNILAAYNPDSQAYALATVVYVAGSSYRRMGARMLVGEDGTFVGGISGGCLEGDALKRARLAILTDVPSIVRYDTSKDDVHQIGVGLGCNGIIDVLFKPINPQDPQNPIKFLQEREQSTRQITSYVTITKSTQSHVLGNIYNITNSLPSFLENFVSEIGNLTQTQVLNLTPDLSIFYEVLPPPIHIYIHGHQYDIYSLISLIQYIGWEYTAVAPKSKLKSNISYQEPDGLFQIKYDKYSAALIMSHDYNADKKTLSTLANSNLPYIGILGPKVRSQKLIAELHSEGLTLPSNEILYYPMGLDLGGQSPEEIALSIISEIKAVFANRPATSLKYREYPIYDRN
jgi:xanthine dehydrogenase accessory factor